MKAALFIAPQQFIVEEIPEPKVPPGGLLLKVWACGICGSDLRRWKEGPPPNTRIIAGHEIAGEVIAVGEGVTKYVIGDRLAVAPDIHCGSCYYCQRGLYNLCDDLHFLGITPGYPGGFAEKMLITPEVLANGIVHLIPLALPDLQAALAEPCSSVLACHQKAGTNLRDVVLVMGAGPIGCLHVAIAKSRGATVILSEPMPIRRVLAEVFQPDDIIDPTREDIVLRVRELTSERGVDIAICANPVGITQTQAVELVRKGGRVVLFGGLPKANPMVTLDSNRIHYGEIEVVGAFSYHPTYHEQALDILRRGLIPADHLITHQFKLDDINIAFETAAQGEALKVIVTP